MPLWKRLLIIGVSLIAVFVVFVIAALNVEGLSHRVGPFFGLVFILGVLALLGAGIAGLVSVSSNPPPHSGSGSQQQFTSVQVPDVAARLTQLAHLRASGALNDAEFEEAKRRAISDQ
jgi:hypothetical protein